jgi:hypothetical protein
MAKFQCIELRLMAKLQCIKLRLMAKLRCIELRLMTHLQFPAARPQPVSRIARRRLIAIYSRFLMSGWLKYL